LVNLVGNAVKFTRKGKVEVTVSQESGVRSRRSGSKRQGELSPESRILDPEGRVRLLFTVSDTGIGIPAKARDRLFVSFSQVDDSTARAFGGTGLGLAISKQLVEGMGGSIRARSEEGKGSVFAFSIPFAAAAAEPLEPEAAAALAEEAASISTQVRVLVAEDEPVNREVVIAYLQRRGWQVMAVRDGRAAVEAVSSEVFDVVLMDVQMPGLDGYEATRLIREREGPGGARVPIICLTAHALKGDREKCLEAGMDDYLAKPVEPEMLYATVERWVGSRPGLRPPKGAPDRTARAWLLSSRSGGSEPNAKVVRSFLDSLSESLGNIREALSKRDAGQVGFWAHRLGGTLSVYGFDVAGIARDIETRAAKNRLAGVGELVTRMEGEIEQIKAVLAGSPSA
jgi:CheY-like chemotaxis protein/HPt (histidine-containing phosphotransfer) domain-containing protein